MAIGRALYQWLDVQHIHPSVIGQFDDYSLLVVFAEAGQGIFAAPLVLDRKLQKKLGFVRIERMQAVDARYYIIAVEKRIKNPVVIAISEVARNEIFS